MTSVPECVSPKTHYRNYASAEKALARILADPDPWREKHPCKVIKCDHCPDFVLSSSPKRPETDLPIPPRPALWRTTARRGSRRRRTTFRKD